MKKLLCVIAILMAFQPEAYAQRGAPNDRNRNAVGARDRVVVVRRDARPRRVVVVRPERRPRRVVVVPPRRHYARDMVRCRDGVLRRARPGACAGHGGRR